MGYPAPDRGSLFGVFRILMLLTPGLFTCGLITMLIVSEDGGPWKIPDSQGYLIILIGALAVIIAAGWFDAMLNQEVMKCEGGFIPSVLAEYIAWYLIKQIAIIPVVICALWMAAFLVLA